MPDLHATGSEGHGTNFITGEVVQHNLLTGYDKTSWPTRQPATHGGVSPTTAGQLVTLEQPGGELAAVIADRGVLAQRSEEINILLPRLIVALDLVQQ